MLSSAPAFIRIDMGGANVLRTCIEDMLPATKICLP